MIPLRIMLFEGEGEFRNYINRIRDNPFTPRPDLDNPPYSQEFSPRVMVDELHTFQSKMEMAEYLDRTFTQSGVRREDVIGKDGLWTWLAYLWFDRLAPVNPKTGKRDVKGLERYIYNPGFRRYYRHYVRTPYEIYSLYKDNSSVRILLYSPVYKHNDFIEQVASRQFIISHPNLIEALFILYFDRASGRPKRGAQSRRRAGNIHRFVKVIQQFELTYDIYSLSAQEIIDLLPEEFAAWK